MLKMMIVGAFSINTKTRSKLARIDRQESKGFSIREIKAVDDFMLPSYARISCYNLSALCFDSLTVINLSSLCFMHSINFQYFILIISFSSQNNSNL